MRHAMTGGDMPRMGLGVEQDHHGGIRREEGVEALHSPTGDGVDIHGGEPALGFAVEIEEKVVHL